MKLLSSLMPLSSLISKLLYRSTLVATEHSSKRIDEIEVGDKVWAYDIETDSLELQEVTRIYVKESKEILHLTLSTGDIDTTTNHPFYELDKGWVAAGDLDLGDRIYTIDGDVAIVEAYWIEKLEEPVRVYNLEVEGYHTYFVGGVLVHNNYEDYDEGSPKSERVGKQKGKAPRDNKKQNEQTKTIAKKLGLSKKQSRQLHDYIGNEGHGYQEVLSIAKGLFGKK